MTAYIVLEKREGVRERKIVRKKERKKERKKNKKRDY